MVDSKEHELQQAVRAPSWAVYVIAAIVPALVTLVLLSWYPRVDPNSHFSGLFQSDMPTYLCNARAAARSPTLLSYASPWDMRNDPKPLLVQWPVTALGALLAVGLSPAATEQVVRLAGGFLMYVLLAWILAQLLPNRLIFWSAFLTSAVGGGVAWAYAFLEHDPTARIERAIMHVQAGYYWWCVDLFRNLLYPLELMQHCIVFAYLLALMQRRMWLAILFLALGAAASPFVAVMLFGIHAICCIPDFRTHMREHALAGLLAGLFILHYKVFMANDPALGSVMAQHQHNLRYSEPLSWQDTLTGHGIALLALPALVFDARFRARLLVTRAAWPPIAMGAVSMLLIHHSRFPWLAPMMPKHFTRGYPFIGMWTIVFLWLQDIAARRPRLARTAGIAALLCVPLTLPDNISFMVDQYRMPPRRLLLWPASTEALLAYLRALPGHLRILAEDTTISRQICAMTDHMTVFGTGMVTPDYEAHRERMRRFLDNPQDATALGDWRIDAILLSSEMKAKERKLAADGQWKLRFKNDKWILFLRTQLSS